MEYAVKDLTLEPDILLLDAVGLPGVRIEQKSIIKGESVSASIAAASIIAKVVRDDIMHDLHEKYPVYNFRGHKGYSTGEHMALIRKYGPCPVHRKSFRRVGDVPLPFGGPFVRHLAHPRGRRDRVDCNHLVDSVGHRGGGLVALYRRHLFTSHGVTPE